MKKLNTSPISGMLELLPNEQAIFNKYKTELGEVFRHHGFLNIETPVIDRQEILLAKAGGEVVAGQIKTKVLPYYQQIGISAQNTYITINQDGTYSASFRGTPMSGRWTYDEASSRMSLQGLLLNLNCYAKRNMNGIALLFDASKLLTLLQTAAAMSGNQNIQTIGDISKSYDGVRLGFDFSR